MTGIRVWAAIAAGLLGTAGAADAQIYYTNPSAIMYGQYPAVYAAPMYYPYNALYAPGVLGNYNYNFGYTYNYGYATPAFGNTFYTPSLYNAYNTGYFFNRAYQYGTFGNPYGYRFR